MHFQSVAYSIQRNKSCSANSKQKNTLRILKLIRLTLFSYMLPILTRLILRLNMDGAVTNRNTSFQFADNHYVHKSTISQ